MQSSSIKQFLLTSSDFLLNLEVGRLAAQTEGRYANDLTRVAKNFEM